MTKDKTYRELDDIDLSISTRIMKDSPDFGGVQIDMRLRLTEKAKQAIQEHTEGKVLEGRIDEVGKFIDAITENEAEREMRGEDCIESHQWQRLSEMADYRIKQLRDKGGSE